MAIAWASAGTLAETETSGAGLSPTCPATVNAGDILIAHVVYLNITSSPSEPADWDLVYGPANLGTGTAVGRAWLYGKVAVGDEDGDAISFGTAGGTSGRFARIHRFTGRVSGTLAECVPASQMSDIPTEGSIPLPTVTTTITGGLAVAFLVQDDNNSFSAASGESGGTWTEPTAEDVDTAIGAQGYVFGIQTCTPTGDPGTVTGGTANATADEGSSIGIEIRPENVIPAQDLTGTLFQSAPTFFTGAITTGAVDLAGTLFQKAPTFFTGEVEGLDLAQDLGGTLFQSAPAFFQGVVVRLLQDLTGTLFQKAPTFSTGAVTPGAVDLAGVLYQNAPSFPTGTVTPGAVAVAGTIFQLAPTFFIGGVARVVQHPDNPARVTHAVTGAGIATANFVPLSAATGTGTSSGSVGAGKAEAVLTEGV